MIKGQSAEAGNSHKRETVGSWFESSRGHHLGIEPFCLNTNIESNADKHFHAGHIRRYIASQHGQRFSIMIAKRISKEKASRSNKRSYSCPDEFCKVFQFHVSLLEITPLIWRRIQVPDCYTFWDLHCAITDAYGWLDYHLHRFTIATPGEKEVCIIGIPDNEGIADRETLPGWEQRIVDYFVKPNQACEYEYDFGDGWRHAVALEEMIPREVKATYPRCIAGERCCPPEDVGGPWGYEHFLKAISCKNSPDHRNMLQWCGGWFDPEWIDLSLIRFSDPALRWRIGFEDAPVPRSMRAVQYHRLKAEP